MRYLQIVIVMTLTPRFTMDKKIKHPKSTIHDKMIVNVTLPVPLVVFTINQPTLINVSLVNMVNLTQPECKLKAASVTWNYLNSMWKTINSIL